MEFGGDGSLVYVLTHCPSIGPGCSQPPHLASFFQGFRTLEDIRSQASLTTQQTIGLKHYDDFLERIPREEAAEIEQTVSRCPRAVRSLAISSWPGSKSGTPDPSAGKSEEAVEQQRLGPVRKEQVETEAGGEGGFGREGLQHQVSGLG